jgi:subtilisin family serine protease
MKIVLSIMISVLLLGGCGSTTVDSAEASTKPDEPSLSSYEREEVTPPSGKGYALYNYLLPNTASNVESYKYNKNGTLIAQETLAYSGKSGKIIEKSLQNSAGYISYALMPDKESIAVSLYHDSVTESFSMKNFVNISEPVTIQNGQCYIKAHHDKLQSYEDVLEIRCPNSTGYYQKDRGLVAEQIFTQANTKGFEQIPRFPNRKIGHVDGFEPKSRLGSLNVDSAKIAHADRLWGAPYHLNGQGMQVGLVDGGSVLSTHVELQNRVTNLSNKDSDLHATHVAGTMISAGSHLASSRGFANRAELYAFSYHDINFAKSVQRFANSYGIFISNHSYGYEGSEGQGIYDDISKELDDAISDNPSIIAVLAAGNYGDAYMHDRDFKEWGVIKGGSNAKNVITVAAIDNESNKISSFSSRGPIKGGRLKPDIATDGENVLSTSNHDNTAYKRMFGTSMATPAATGAITLIAQRYKQVNGTNVHIDTMKAILFNSAKDIENRGPDFKSGFGSLDAYAAVKVVDTMAGDASLVKSESIEEGETKQYAIHVEENHAFKVTAAWVDAGSASLSTDIDMLLVERASGRKIYPYTLQENLPTRDAMQDRENHVDPQEQIVFYLRKGDYTLYIEGKKIPSGSQKFALVSTLPLSSPQSNIVRTPINTHIHKIYKSIR